MRGDTRGSQTGRRLAWAGGLLCSVCAVAQEPDPEPELPPPWLERVTQALERVETEQQALRQEVERLRAQADTAPDPGSVLDPSSLFEAEIPAVPVPENPPEIQGIIDELTRLGAEQQALREEVEAWLARRDEAAARETEAAAIEDTEEPAAPAEPAAEVPDLAPGTEEAEAGGAMQDSEGDEAAGASEEKVFSPRVSQPAARLYGQGREAFRNLNFYAAAKAFREFLVKYPTHEDAGEARYWLGETLYVEGRFEEAIAAFAEVLADASSPRREAARLKTGYAWFELGEYGRAEAILIEVRDQNPDSDLARLAQSRLDRLQRRTGGE